MFGQKHRGGNREISLSSIEFQFTRWKILKTDDGDGYSTVWMYLTSLNYILQMLSNDVMCMLP